MGGIGFYNIWSWGCSFADELAAGAYVAYEVGMDSWWR